MKANIIAEFQRARIKAFADLWEPRLDLPGVDVSHAFIEDVYDTGDSEDHWTCADTQYDFHYRDARIRWYLPSCARLNDDDLESIVVHEYCHILLGCLDPYLKRKAREDKANELATETVARALLCTAKAVA